MSKKLEDFIRNNKEAFDDYTPSDALWQRIEKKLDPEKGDGQPPARLFVLKSWMKVAAVAALLITTATVFYNLNRNVAPTPEQTANNDNNPVSDRMHVHREPVTGEVIPEENNAYDEEMALKATRRKQGNIQGKTATEERELYHYAKLIEIKQGQMRELKTSEPRLYKEFSKDFEMLETSYEALKAQFTTGVNTEKLLEAMIGNLKMQADLLNKQLGILKQIQNKKNTDDEEDYKKL